MAVGEASEAIREHTKLFKKEPLTALSSRQRGPFFLRHRRPTVRASARMMQ